MRILQTPPRFRPYIGGVENYAYYLSKELVKGGHDVTVVCANEPRSKSKDRIEGIAVKRLRYAGKVANTNITPGLPAALLKEEFDVVNTYIPTPWSADWSAFAAVLKRKPLVVTYHNDIVGRGISNYLAKVYNATALKCLLRRADRIVITTPEYLNSSPYLKRYKDKVEVIPIGVDTSRFRPGKVEREEENLILFLSVLDEFHRYKGLDVLLEAMRLVTKEADAKLLVGGGGAMLEEYMELSERLGIDDKVEFLGFVPEEGLVDFYNRGDVFVLPSVSKAQEGFGIVLLEAMACGRAVVCTDVAGVAEAVAESGAGNVVEPSDSEALAAGIIAALGDSGRMGRKARKLVEEGYSWGRVVSSIETAYEKLM